MKKIILSLGAFLLIAQNGFAETDAEWDKKINNAYLDVDKQMFKCMKDTLNHPTTGDVNKCLKAEQVLIKFKKERKSIDITEGLSTIYLNTGLLYSLSNKDKIKAYKYYLKSAKLGGDAGIQAQYNLDDLCQKSSWVCKR